jgi:hypothetical protein
MAASQPRLSSGGSPFERRRRGGERHPQANPLAEHHDRAGKPLDTGRSVTNDLCKATVTEMREGDKSSRMTFRNKPRSSTPDAYSSDDVSARNCWQHALLACHVSPGTQNARSLLGGPLRTVAHTRGSAAAVDRRHWSRRLRPTRLPWSSRTVGAVDRTRDRVFDELVGRWQSVHRRYGQRRFSSDHQAELLGRIVRVHL